MWFNGARSHDEMMAENDYYAPHRNPNPNKMFYFNVYFQDGTDKEWSFYIHPEDVWGVIMYNIQNHIAVDKIPNRIEMT